MPPLVANKMELDAMFVAWEQVISRAFKIRNQRLVDQK
jgi:hypothetical protein